MSCGERDEGGEGVGGGCWALYVSQISDYFCTGFGDNPVGGHVHNMRHCRIRLLSAQSWIFQRLHSRRSDGD